MEDLPTLAESPVLCLRRTGRAASISAVGDLFPVHVGVTTFGRSKTGPAAAATALQSEASCRRHVYVDSSVNKCLISRQHARIKCWLDDTNAVNATVCDLSVNGVFVNDTKIDGVTALHVGDVITFGHLRGAALAPGAMAAQPDSEFKFRMDRYASEVDSALGEPVRLQDAMRSGTAALAGTLPAGMPTRTVAEVGTTAGTAVCDSREHECATAVVAATASIPCSKPTDQLDVLGDGLTDTISSSQQSIQSSSSYCFSTGLVYSSASSPAWQADEAAAGHTGSDGDDPDIDLSDVDSTILAIGRGMLPASNQSPVSTDGRDVCANDRCVSRLSALHRTSGAGSLAPSPGSDASPRCSTSDSSARYASSGFSSLQRRSNRLSAPTYKRKRLDGSPEGGAKRRHSAAASSTATTELGGDIGRSGSGDAGGGKRGHGAAEDDLKYHEDEDRCASVDCEQPGADRLLDWVQCDACHLWYHVPCILSTVAASTTSIDVIKQSQFHCGCV